MSAPPLGAFCATHATSNAVATCTRCGNFMCATCHQGALCPACVARTGSSLTSEFKPCPNCQAQNATRVGYTWWGGVLGPKLFTHVTCGTCGAAYNGKTGRSNTANIVIYSVVLAVVVIGLYAAFRF